MLSEHLLCVRQSSRPEDDTNGNKLNSSPIINEETKMNKVCSSSKFYKHTNRVRWQWLGAHSRLGWLKPSMCKVASELTSEWYAKIWRQSIPGGRRGKFRSSEGCTFTVRTRISVDWTERWRGRAGWGKTEEVDGDRLIQGSGALTEFRRYSQDNGEHFQPFSGTAICAFKMYSEYDSCSPLYQLFFQSENVRIKCS